ncbi:MAG: hypothetical protein GWO07_02865 [Candidatus Dadabacteria bacterium]|nr:hypothetical protein [Candidatus Dadabacteria bacterium]NIS07708.1 hypothetical protein [Candidatus Dadabacteria bacterium]NIV42287.1 hypothetical protein [Candidatus Dadabacteria bacterium]NIX14794.1 hypothetical protein [Candidatus Dadabacteria bacterium]NIY21335.1 hypothetical protein [Candidatus Dadabacteria bacterium]
MKVIIEAMLSGLVGTAGMTVVMWLITRSGLAHADMIRAIGSIFTRSYKDSVIPGIIVHFGVGMIIAFFYVLIISILDPVSTIKIVGAGAMIGIFHGVTFSFLLVVAVAEHHPLEQFKTAGSEVAVAHLAGHIVYGLLVGAVVAATGVKIVL